MKKNIKNIKNKFVYTLNRVVKRYFSDGRKKQFVSFLNSVHLNVIMLDLHVKSIIKFLKQIEAAAEQARDTKIPLSLKEEVVLYDTKKKFFEAERASGEMIQREIRKIDLIVAELKAKPDWISKSDETEILEDLREVIILFFSNVKLLCKMGESYIYLTNSDKGVLEDKILAYGLEMKLSLVKFSNVLKRDFMPIICFILKEVQIKWSWMNEEEKEAVKLALKQRHEEKVAIAKQRKKERLLQDRISKDFINRMKWSTK